MINSQDELREASELIVEELLMEDGAIFNQYFNDAGTIPNLDSETRKKAEKLYNKARQSANINENFWQFVERVQKEKRTQDCGTEMNFEFRNVETQTNCITQQNSMTQTSVQDGFRGNSNLEDDSLCSNNYFDPTIRRILPLNFTPSTRKRKEEFDAVQYLMYKKVNQDYYPLTFQSEEDVQDLLTTIESCPEKKRLDLLAEGVLRKIAEHLETLNRVCNYRLMDVHYEKAVY